MGRRRRNVGEVMDGCEADRRWWQSIVSDGLSSTSQFHSQDNRLSNSLLYLVTAIVMSNI